MNPSRKILCASLFAIATAVSITLGGCEDNPAALPDQQLEEIKPNIVVLHLVNQTNPMDSTSANFHDPDGDGGANPMIDTLTLAGGVVYTGSVFVSFVGKINNRDTVIDFAPEYTELGRYHQFFYTPGGTGADRITVTVTDKDSTNLPIGLATTVAVTPGAAESATLRIELGHYDDPAQPKDGTRLPYEHDIDVVFPVNIR